MLADQQRGSMPQVLERMTAEVGREKERARRLREQSDEKEREVRRMVLRAVEMEKRMRVMERMLLDHRASMGRKDRGDEAREREEEGQDGRRGARVPRTDATDARRFDSTGRAA